LAEVGPEGGLVREAFLVGLLCRPYYTGAGSGRVEACVRLVSVVGVTELAMDFRALFCRSD
jgi:hypothetical protein